MEQVSHKKTKVEPNSQNKNKMEPNSQNKNKMEPNSQNKNKIETKKLKNNHKMKKLKKIQRNQNFMRKMGNINNQLENKNYPHENFKQSWPNPNFKKNSGQSQNHILENKIKFVTMKKNIQIQKLKKQLEYQNGKRIYDEGKKIYKGKKIFDGKKIYNKKKLYNGKINYDGKNMPRNVMKDRFMILNPKPSDFKAFNLQLQLDQSALFEKFSKLLFNDETKLLLKRNLHTNIDAGRVPLDVRFYLELWETDRDNWLFNKEYDDYLMDSFLNPDRISDNTFKTLLEYSRKTQGMSKESLIQCSKYALAMDNDFTVSKRYKKAAMDRALSVIKLLER